VSGLTSGVIAISAGTLHTCALTNTGGVKCWGFNYPGILGDGTRTNSSTPVSVIGLSSGVGGISAGDDHTCALILAVGVKCWGYNDYGQLGDGTTSDHLTPVVVSGISSSVSSISINRHYGCALLSAGGVKCWGRNDWGQLGDGTITNRSIPVSVIGLTNIANAISTGELHACIKTGTGGVKCWGNNEYGQLGDGSTWQTTPVWVSGLLFDTNAPLNPVSLESSSHVINRWSTVKVIRVAWTGASDLESGIGGYSVIWDNRPLSLPDPIKNIGSNTLTTTSTALADGAWYFHIRAVDKAGNWASGAVHIGPFKIDSTLPTSWATASAYATKPFTVTWRGTDNLSGISTYNVWLRDGPNGTWGVWRSNVTSTQGLFAPVIAGHIYYFRSQAIDTAGNIESDVPPDGDTRTIVAGVIVSGRVLDASGKGVFNATVSAVPPSIQVAQTDVNGLYTLPLIVTGTYTLTAQHPAYGILAPLNGIWVGSGLTGIDFILPQPNDTVDNGAFETGNLSSWGSDSGITATSEISAAHSGRYGMYLRTDIPLVAREARLADAPCITQSVTISAGWKQPTLSWIARGVVGSAEHFLVVRLIGSVELSATMPLATSSWQHTWLNAAPLKGETVVLCIGFRTVNAPQEVLVDEVSLGDTPPGPRHRFLPISQR